MLVRGLFGLRRVVRNGEVVGSLQSRLLSSSPEESKASTPATVEASIQTPKLGPKKVASSSSAYRRFSKAEERRALLWVAKDEEILLKQTPVFSF